LVSSSKPKSGSTVRPRSTSRSGPPAAARPAGKNVPAGKNASARAQLAEERQRQERRRRRLLLVILPVAVVLVAVGALIVVRLTRSTPTSGPAAATGTDAVISAVTSVPGGVLDQVGVGSVTVFPKPVDAPALTEGGKPRVLYVGAEYCPYCAAERWPMVVAMSRFGTFTGLGQTASSARDVSPSTPTLTFHGSSFSSPTVAFTGVETESNQIVNGQYAPLDQLSAADEQVFSTYNSPPYVDQAGSIPFVDIGGRYLIAGASYSPDLLKGKTHQQIASALADPTSEIAQAVDGTANVITAAICASTKNAPADVCSAAGVQAAAKNLS
jgi:hypothetical protein